MRNLRWKRLLLLLLGGLIVWLGASAWVTWSYSRRASALFDEPSPSVDWAQFESHRLTTEDGQQIGAWLALADAPRGCVLVMHGNGDSRSSMVESMRIANKNGFHALAISLRAHGDSTGEWNDFGWSARHDVVTAVAFLEQRFPGSPITIVGRSLGAAAAIFAADTLGERVSGYFLEQPYKDLDSATWNRVNNYLPVGLDWLAYAGLRVCAPVMLPFDIERVSPAQRASDIPSSVPVVIVTGSDDRHARLADVEEVFRQVASHGHLLVFDGATHEPLDQFDPEQYEAVLTDCLVRPIDR